MNSRNTILNLSNDLNFMVSWDEFYAENYQWALKCISHHEPNFIKARKLLDKIFLNLTLDPIEELNDEKKLKNSLSIKLAGVIARINREKRKSLREKSTSLMTV